MVFLLSCFFCVQIPISQCFFHINPPLVKLGVATKRLLYGPPRGAASFAHLSSNLFGSNCCSHSVSFCLLQGLFWYSVARLWGASQCCLGVLRLVPVPYSNPSLTSVFAQIVLPFALWPSIDGNRSQHMECKCLVAIVVCLGPSSVLKLVFWSRFRCCTPSFMSDSALDCQRGIAKYWNFVVV